MRHPPRPITYAKSLVLFMRHSDTPQKNKGKHAASGSLRFTGKKASESKHAARRSRPAADNTVSEAPKRRHLAPEAQTTEPRAQSRGTGKVRRWSAVICCVALALVLSAVVIMLLQMHMAKQGYEQLAEQAHSGMVSPEYVPATPTPEPTPEPTAEPTAEPSPTPSPEPAEIPVDFEYLCGINDDIIGWITVDGTDIDYPILYDVINNSIYLDHDYWLAYSVAGSIFVQSYNYKDFSGFNTVVYGHDMNNGSMFAQLHRFREHDFFEEHDTITIYTPDRKLTYQIFAAYRTDNKNISVVFDFSTEENRQAYIDRIYTHGAVADFDMDVAVEQDDKIITLSTCYENMNEYRYLVQAVLVSDEPGVYSPE